MAHSPAHRLGQIIGDWLEGYFVIFFRSIAQEYGLYLDFKHPRPAREGKKEIQWVDINNNKHKLDVVIEAGGSENLFGTPKAFIEIAWRRYTKHSKNKAQEISGAIKPLVAKYAKHCPFYGAVLAGEFTENSLAQIRSEGFKVLYFSMNSIEEAFASQNILIHWVESTAESELQIKVDCLDALSLAQKNAIWATLLENNRAQVDDFAVYLRSTLERHVEQIRVVSLYGSQRLFSSIADACDYIALSPAEIIVTTESLYRYEVCIKYSNGDKIEMQFKEQQAAISSLMQLI